MAERPNCLDPVLPESKVSGVSYPKIREGYPQLWAVLKTGELIAMTAIRQGIELSTPKAGTGDEWINCLPERVMSELCPHGDLIARKVLKETRQLVNSCPDLVNGDRKMVLSVISNLMKTLGGPKDGFKLPPILPIPSRH